MSEENTNAQQNVLAQFTTKEIAVIQQIEEVVKNTEIALLGATGKITKTFAMARGIQALRAQITPEMMTTYVMPLMNTPLGFKTDKDPKRKVQKEGQWIAPTPYPMEVVKDCIITVMLRGGQIVGNEFNIISGQAYFTKEYFQRALGELPGVTNIVASPGLPVIEGKKAKIRYGLSWKVKGISDQLKDTTGAAGRVFEIRCDAYSSVDQIIGKADRKAYAAAYRQIVGSELAIPDGDADDFVDGTVVPTEPKTGASAMNNFVNETQKKTEPVAQPAQTKPVDPPADMNPATGEIPDQGDGEPDHEARGDDEPGEQKQQEQNPPQGGKPLADDVSTYDAFYEAASGAVDPSITPSDFSRGIGMALMICGKKGKQNETTEEWRREVLAAIREGRFDWASGKITAK